MKTTRHNIYNPAVRFFLSNRIGDWILRHILRLSPREVNGVFADLPESNGVLIHLTILEDSDTHGNSRQTHNNFEYNKDADMYVCEAGHMSIKKTSTRPKKHAEDGNGTVESYFFDVEKCKH